MRLVLSKIIDPVQSAIVSNHSIHDNILLTHEVMNKFKNMKGKKSWIAFKLDMEKAYDRVEWNFLFEALKQLGFHPRWIYWIKECISTDLILSLSMIEITGFFSPSRGIRQDDPLSPYLFLIRMEVLTRELRKAQNTKKSGIGFKMSPKANKIPCLLFADDSLLFCRSNLESCQHLSRLLVNFCRNSGNLLIFISRSSLPQKMRLLMTSKLLPQFLIFLTKIVLGNT